MPDNPPTLIQHCLDNSTAAFDGVQDLAALVGAIASAAEVISAHINRGALADIMGSVGSTNTTGDDQQKLDVIGDDAIARELAATGIVCAMSSEENEGLIQVDDIKLSGPYAVAYDPVDGSSNIDVAAPIGTIFGVYRRVTPGNGTGDMSDLLQPGSAMVAAGYVLYGSSTILAYTTGSGVHYLTLDPHLNDFILTRESVTKHGSSKVYSVNEGNSRNWHMPDANWVAHVKSEGYSARYIGALVADFHRNLQKGGIYAYPGDKRSPDGKIRLLFESAPLAFVAEAAGGAATDGTVRILDIVPTKLHHRTPVYIGSKEQVESLAGFHASA